MTTYTWHPTRPPYGMVLGPHDGATGYPVEVNAITYAEAVERFGDVTVGKEIPIVIDRKETP